MTDYHDAIIQKYSYNEEVPLENNDDNEYKDDVYTNKMTGGVRLSDNNNNNNNKILGGALQDYFIPIGINYKEMPFTEKNIDNFTDNAVIDGGMYEKLFNMIGSQETNKIPRYSAGSTRKKNKR